MSRVLGSFDVKSGSINFEQPEELQMPLQLSPTFLEGMIARMLVSAFKYGDLNVAYPTKVNALKSMQQRVDKYLATGNTEFLMDAANCLMIEFMRPSVEGAFFQPTDSDQSPGRTWNAGNTSQAPNTQEMQRERDRAKRTPLGQFRDSE